MILCSLGSSTGLAEADGRRSKSPCALSTVPPPDVQTCLNHSVFGAYVFMFILFLKDLNGLILGSNIFSDFTVFPYPVPPIEENVLDEGKLLKPWDTKKVKMLLRLYCGQVGLI